MAARQESFLSVPHLLVFFVLWLVVQAVTMLIARPEVLAGAQVDTDGYLRLVRVRQLLDGASWFDGGIPRSNWPYGESHHWTRPLDALILLVMLPLRAFFDPDTALAVAGAVISPLCHLAVCVAAVWAVQPLVRGPERFFAMPAALTQPTVMAYGGAGRADHHMLIFLLCTLALGAWIRALLEPDDRRAPVAAGALVGFGIWVGPETMLPLALLFLSGGLAWVTRGPKLLRANLRLCLGLACALLVAILLEHPPGAWLTPEFDRLSVAHLHMSLVALGFWWVASQWSSHPVKGPPVDRRHRAILSVAGAALAAGVMFLLHPAFFKGPWAGVDPTVTSIWLQHVRELKPLWPRHFIQTGSYVAQLGAGWLMIPFLSVWLRHEGDAGRRSVWLLLLGFLVLFVPLASFQMRFSPYVGVVSTLAIVELLRRALHRVTGTGGLREAVTRVAVILAVLLWPLGVLTGFVVAATRTEPTSAGGPKSVEASGCPLTSMAIRLGDPAGLGSRPRTVAAFPDFGPEILYRTPHRVLAGPYHRNGAGILAAYQLLTTADAAAAEAIVAERSVDLLLLCPARDSVYFGRSGPNSLYNRLVHESQPGWLRPVAPVDSGFRLFEVVAAKR